MVLATTSGTTFYAGYFAALGSLLVLFSFVTTDMPDDWSKNLGGGGAICLTVATALGLHSDFGTYGEKHLEQTALAILVLVVMLVCVLWHVFRPRRPFPMRSPPDATTSTPR